MRPKFLISNFQFLHLELIKCNPLKMYKLQKYKQMKIIVLLIIAGLTFGMLTSCKDKPDKSKTVITERIQYDVNIKSPDPDYDRWVQNIDKHKREAFVNMIMDAAYSGKIQAYDYFNNPISVEQVKSIGVDTIYKILTRDYPPYDEYDTVIISKFELKDITKIRFLEEWYIDEDNLEIEKKIIGIAPVIEKYDQSGNLLGFQPLFWLYLEKNYPIDQD